MLFRKIPGSVARGLIVSQVYNRLRLLRRAGVCCWFITGNLKSSHLDVPFGEITVKNHMTVFLQETESSVYQYTKEAPCLTKQIG